MVNHDDKWPKEKKALRKLQIHFIFKQDVHRQIWHDAADASLNPSDIVRKVVGLGYSKIQRPRVGLSFSEEELQSLAGRYGVDRADEKEIKRRVMDEVDHYYSNGGKSSQEQLDKGQSS